MSELARQIHSLSEGQRTLLDHLLTHERPRSGTGLPILPVSRRSQHFPLTAAQMRLWFEEQLEPGKPTWNIIVPLRIEGDLNVPRLQRCFGEIIRRHEALRAKFRTVADEARQFVGAPYEITVEQLPIGGHSRAERLDKALRRAVTEGSRAFNLATGPLLRVVTGQLSDDEHFLLIITHHIVADGWSINVLLGEIAELYRADLEGRPAALPELSVQLVDYACWERRRIDSDEFRAGIESIRQRLIGAPPLVLPCDRRRSSASSTRGAVRTRLVPHELVRALTAVAVEAHASLFLAMGSVFLALLYQHSRQTDMVIGTAVANRSRVEIEPLIGCFANLLVLRVDLSGDPTFRELLLRTREAFLENSRHSDAPFEKIADTLRSARDALDAPVRAVFQFQNAPVDNLQIPWARVTRLSHDPGTTRFEFTLLASSTANGLELLAQFATDLFSPSRIEELLEQYVLLLERFATNPDLHIGELGDHQFQADQGCRIGIEPRLQATKAVEPATPAVELVHRLIEQAAARFPDAVAVRDHARIICYGELDRRADGCAQWLASAGATNERLVALCLDRSLELIVWTLAVLKAGAAFVPIDPGHPAARRNAILADCRPALIVDATTRMPAPATRRRQFTVEPQSLAYVIYTSGTTGQPKGVMVPHACLANYLSWSVRGYDLRPGEIVPLHSTISADLTLTSLLAPLLVGACVDIVSEKSESLPILQLLRHRSHFDLIKMTPTHLRGLLADRAGLAVPQGARLVLGGEQLRASDVNGWRALGGGRVVNEYGPTETTVGCSSAEVGELASEELIPIGGAITATRLVVLDDGLQCAAPGKVGELYIGGNGVARGYLEAPALTAERFLPDLTGSGATRMYRSGDLATMSADGELRLHGRIDHQLKILGHRIEPAEIEATLAEHPSVQEVAIVAQMLTASNSADAPEQSLVAFVARRPAYQDSAVDLTEQLRARVAERLPPAFVPSRFQIVESLPRTTSGKLDRQAIMAMPCDGASRPTFVPPRDGLEAQLAALYAEVLRCECVGANDNFFELGGDSMLCLQLASRARRAGIAMTPRHVFRYQTIARLAEALATAQSETISQPGPGPTPLVPLQRRILERKECLPLHIQAVGFELTQPIDVETMQAALTELVARHDALRIRFRKLEAGWAQEVTSTEHRTPMLKVIDLSGLRPALEDAFDAAVAQLRSTIDIEHGPIFAAALFLLGHNKGNRLVLVAHHLVMDAVSWRLLVEDLAALYARVVGGAAAPATNEVGSFRQCAQRLDTHAHRRDLKLQLPFWSQCAQGVRPLAGRGAMGSGAVGIVTEWLDGATAAAVLGAQGTAAEMTLAAFLLAYSSWSGQSQILIDFENHGRDTSVAGAEVVYTVGPFAAHCPLCIDLTGLTNSSEALQLIRKQMRNVADRSLEFGLLRYMSGDPEAAYLLSSALSPELCFNYLGAVYDERTSGNPFGARLLLRSPTTLLAPHHLVANVWTYGARLELELQYDTERFDAVLVTRLARRWLAELAGLAKTGRDDRITLPAGYALSPMQQGILFHSLCAPNSGVYVASVSCRIEGELRRDAFREAWRRAAACHEVVRTGFAWAARRDPVQFIEPSAELSVTELDWSDLGEEARDDRMEILIREERLRGFDLSQPPLLRIALIRLDKTLHGLVLTFHHIILDGWSLALLLEDVFAAYNAAKNGRHSEPSMRQHYREYIAHLAQRRPAVDEQFWRTALAKVPRPAHSGWSAPAFVGQSTEILRLASADTQALLVEARRIGVAPSTFLFGAYALALHEAKHDDVVVFGATFAGRPAELHRCESMIGLFINTLPVALVVEVARPVSDWLRGLHLLIGEMKDHELTPLSDIQRWCGAAGPLFDTVMVIENYPRGASLLEGCHGLRFDRVDFVDSSHYPLTLTASLADSVSLRVAFDGKMFDQHFARQLQRDVARLMVALVRDSARTLADILVQTRGGYPRARDEAVDA